MLPSIWENRKLLEGGGLMAAPFPQWHVGGWTLVACERLIFSQAIASWHRRLLVRRRCWVRWMQVGRGQSRSRMWCASAGSWAHTLHDLSYRPRRRRLLSYVWWPLFWGSESWRGLAVGRRGCTASSTPGTLFLSAEWPWVRQPYGSWTIRLRVGSNSETQIGSDRQGSGPPPGNVGQWALPISPLFPLCWLLRHGTPSPRPTEGCCQRNGEGLTVMSYPLLFHPWLGRMSNRRLGRSGLQPLLLAWYTPISCRFGQKPIRSLYRLRTRENRSVPTVSLSISALSFSHTGSLTEVGPIRTSLLKRSSLGVKRHAFRAVWMIAASMKSLDKSLWANQMRMPAAASGCLASRSRLVSTVEEETNKGGLGDLGEVGEVWIRAFRLVQQKGGPQTPVSIVEALSSREHGRA